MDEASRGDFNKSAVAGLHGVDLKPLQTLFYTLVLLAEFEFGRICVHQLHA